MSFTAPEVSADENRKIRFRIGTPIAPEEFFDDGDLDRALDEVEGAVQELMALESA